MEINKKKKYEGGEAIYQLVDDIYCSGHFSEESINENPKFAELSSLLEICEQLLNDINHSAVGDKNSLWTLTKHQFYYRLYPRFKIPGTSFNEIYFCENCQCNHGFPSKIRAHLISITELLEISIKTRNES